MAGSKDKFEKEQVNKDNALKLVMAQAEKEFGKGAVMRLGDKRVSFGMDVIPTGIYSLDIALGVGGFPRGRVV